MLKSDLNIELSPLVLNLYAGHSGFRIYLLLNFKEKKKKKEKPGGFKASLGWSLTNKGINIDVDLDTHNLLTSKSHENWGHLL